ncbi:MAG: K+/H+ antiporter subunit F [Longimicrobiales bacterium]
MLSVAIHIAFTMVTLAILLNLWRLVRGPSAVDRVIALDTTYVNTVALLVLLGIGRTTMLYFEAAAIIAALGFVGTIALCKYLLRGNIIE